MATYATHDKFAVPFYPRASLARRENILTQGDFEDWESEVLPEGFDGPVGVTQIARSPRSTSGNNSLYITWPTSPGPSSVNHRFRTKRLTLDEASTYELFVDWHNPSRNDIAVSAWQVFQDVNGVEQLHRLSPSVVSLDPNSKFLTKAGKFHTVAGADAVVVLAVAPQEGDYPVDVYIDNLRLLKLR